MILKCERGNDFYGLFDYLLRHGQHGHRGDARIIATHGVYDERTAAAQMAYNAALSPDRTRPVVHLIGRAEIGLSDEKNAELARRMVRAAGLDGHPFVAIAHDDGHVHVAVCELDDFGNAPPRVLWSEAQGRAVTAAEAANLPRGSVKSRAWDSNLGSRLIKLAREVEREWGLRQLASTPKVGDAAEPCLERWQQERLNARGDVALQDRYFDQVRSALLLPTWQQRTDALAEHGLKIRIAKYGERERVRGLQVCSMSDARDFVKIAAFGLGGMPKLDATADQPFLQWEARKAGRPVNLNKPERTFDTGFSRLQTEFRYELKEWHRTAARRKAAFARHKREKGLIALQAAKLAESMEPYATPAGLKAASGRLRRELQARAKAELDFALITGGPARKRPVFIEFVQQRAAVGDTDAARVHRNLANKVTETRGRRLDRMRSMLAASLLEIKQSAAKMNAQIQSLAVPLRAAVDSLKVRAAALQAQHTQAMRKRRAAEERAWSDHARVEAGQTVSARQTTQVARIAACAVLHSELYATIREAERRRIEQEDQLARERRQASSAKAEAMAALLNRAQSDAIAREAERRRQLLEAELAHERDRAYRIEATRIAAEAERNARAEASNSNRDRRNSLMAAAKPRDSDSQGTVEYLQAWSSSLRALPAGIAITDQHLSQIETKAVLALLRKGRGEEAVRQIVLGRSPAEHRAKITLASALDNSEVREALAVEADKIDRAQAKSALYAKTPKSEVAELFVDMWDEIFDERAVDPSLRPEDRNRSIDFEVANVLSKRGHSLLDVARALATHSPSVVNLRPPLRSGYAEDVLSDLAERTGLASGWASPISAVDRMDHRAAAVGPVRASSAAPAGENISMAEALHVISRRARLMSAWNAAQRHDLLGADGTRLDDRDNQAVRSEKTPLRIQPSTTLGPSL
ncbi:relaxase/mobilization nuclease domain-containing protein [Blastomonas sp.]|uniref:relaxase/mobilization nuclease domain-containing protein n=1 Tax=Blastomonas sp. TaxID=1909299 RepID=UPI00391C7589